MIAVASSAAKHPGLRSVVADLPVAGFTGSLAYRFQSGDQAGLGMVRAKTGTLTGVHGLTGTVTSVDGAVMSFVAIADRVKLAEHPGRPVPARPGRRRAGGLHLRRGARPRRRGHDRFRAMT